MNIFATSSCPIESAKFLDDKRKIKMLLESAQLLATAIRLHGGPATYRPTHVNHPATIWTRQTRANYVWLLRHFAALCREYTRITGKIHKCSTYTAEFTKGLRYIPKGDLQPFVNCATNDSKGVNFKNVVDTHLAYRLYSQERWKGDVKQPTWR
jgi:hypothetical protein